MVRSIYISLCCVSLISGQVFANDASTVNSRGQILYDKHCLPCHNVEPHWQEKAKATDWQSLQVQVAHWQYDAGLEWRHTDIEEVSRYLDNQYYHFR